MRKLRLDTDALRVESFEPCAGDGRAIGTVRGNIITVAYQTEPCFSCDDHDTCGACANTSPRPDCASDGC